jgi:hypothetical protein
VLTVESNLKETAVKINSFPAKELESLLNNLIKEDNLNLTIKHRKKDILQFSFRAKNNNDDTFNIATLSNVKVGEFILYSAFSNNGTPVVIFQLNERLTND